MDRGECLDGVCHCAKTDDGREWTGPSCQIKGCHDDCNNHGNCLDGQCQCDPQWTGFFC